LKKDRVQSKIYIGNTF